MRFLSFFAFIALFSSSIIAADPVTPSKCLDGATSVLHQSPTGTENVYEAQFLTNEKYHQPDTKYPDYVDLHWSIRDDESKDAEKSFVVRIAHDGQMESASAIAVNQDGIYLKPQQTIRYWHSYSMKGKLCKTEAHSFKANEKMDESSKEEKVKESDRPEPFHSQQATPTAPAPSAPNNQTPPAAPAPVNPPQQQFPEPPATCANDEYFCQIYKQCYSCVANPNQAACAQCNKVFACADVACRQKETCNLCNMWSAAITNQASDAVVPFVCSVVRGQC